MTLTHTKNVSSSQCAEAKQHAYWYFARWRDIFHKSLLSLWLHDILLSRSKSSQSCLAISNIWIVCQNCKRIVLRESRTHDLRISSCLVKSYFIAMRPWLMLGVVVGQVFRKHIRRFNQLSQEDLSYIVDIVHHIYLIIWRSSQRWIQPVAFKIHISVWRCPKQRGPAKSSIKSLSRGICYQETIRVFVRLSQQWRTILGIWWW